MFSKPPVITNAGRTLLLRAAGGEKISFTRFQAGSGGPTGSQTEETMTSLGSVQVANIAVTSAVETEEGYIQLTGGFDNQNHVQNDFVWTELGLLARVDNSEAADYQTEYLYAYGYDNEYAEMIHAGGGSVVVEQTISLIVAIGDSGNITANISENITYATKANLDAHIDDKNNPHEVYPAQIGAAEASHTHNAAMDITGILPVAHGGTGVDSLEELSALISPPSSYVIGFFTGDGQGRKEISLGFTPSKVVLIRMAAGSVQTAFPAYYFESGKNIYHSGCGTAYYTKPHNQLLPHHGGAAVMPNGFAVGYASGGRADINVNNEVYMYIAFK